MTTEMAQGVTRREAGGAMRCRGSRSAGLLIGGCLLLSPCAAFVGPPAWSSSSSPSSAFSSSSASSSSATPAVLHRRIRPRRAASHADGAAGTGDDGGNFAERQIFLERCLDVEEDGDDSLQRELREMGMSDELIQYTMDQRRKRKTPPVGTPAYKGLTAWWCERFGIDID